MNYLFECSRNLFCVYDCIINRQFVLCALNNCLGCLFVRLSVRACSFGTDSGIELLGIGGIRVLLGGDPFSE